MSDFILPATVIGSWSFPGWYEKFIHNVADHPDQYGPVDREEALQDAIRLAVDDQLRAGLDRITDGEMQRVDFNLGFLCLSRWPPVLAENPPSWPPSHDQRDRYQCVESISAPRGLGVVKEYRRFRTLCDRPAKVPVPGPFTLAGCINGGDVYPDRKALTESLIPIVNSELKAVVAEGADFLQLDEPSFACHPDEPDYFLDVVARTVEGVNAYISMHMCFGNFRARAVGWRSYRPLFPHIGRARVNQLALEFASREMAELDLLGQLPDTMDVAVGLVDVKNTWIEPPDLIAERLRSVLKRVDASRVSITPDCGFSQTARHVAVAKTKAMVGRGPAGSERTRNRLAHMSVSAFLHLLAGVAGVGPVASSACFTSGVLTSLPQPGNQ